MSDEHEELALDPRVRWLIEEARQPVVLRADARERLAAALALEPAPVRERTLPRPWRWAVERRTLRLSPLIGGALAAGLVGVGVLAGLLGPARGGTPIRVSDAPVRGGSSPVRPAADATPTPNGIVVEPGVVKFVFVAPTAQRVTLVGDFNQWNPDATPMVRSGATWTVTLPLRAGRHLYSFVVDGTQWLPDPSAPLAPEDGFGHANSVVLVGDAAT